MQGEEPGAAMVGISWGALRESRAYSNEMMVHPSQSGVVESERKVEKLSRENRRRKNREKKGGCSLT